jgi:hypothetical protein
VFQTKIYNLETDEFVSNPPFSKNEFGGSNIAVQFLVGTIRVCFKLNFKLKKKLNYFLTREHLAKGFLFEINLLKLNPYVGIISFFLLEMLLILLPAYVPFGFNILGFHRSIGTIPFS